MLFSKIIATLLIIIPVSISKSAKTNARPVHEVVNEQARIDDKVKISSPGLPYGNPLAGNSQQNAKLHAQNQQAMFNAERVRQHRAQLQRWTKAPIRMDSYMKAYHESQESHQLAVEQQQARSSDVKVAATTPKARRQERREKKVERVRIQSPEPTKITKADAVVKERSRNHRSHGSLDYYQHLEPKRYQTVLVSPAPTYDQGVTIKPNGNVGLSHYQTSHESQLYTEAVPSNTKYVYPKHYSQMQEYHSAQDIETLKSMLKKNPNDQLTDLKTLIITANQNKEQEQKSNLETPIDLYFYLKDSPRPTLAQQYDYTKYAQIPHYASSYMPEPAKDHKPITEEVDDIEDPNKINKLRTYAPQAVQTQALQETQDTTTTKSNNYYKVEVASQTISTGHKAQYKEPDYYVNEDPAQPSYANYQALQYAPPPAYHGKDEGDQSERYLHHNAQHTGVQHLTGDGTGVSAYGDDSVSNQLAKNTNNRKRRSTLDTNPFLIPGDTNSTVSSNDTAVPQAESLIRLNPLVRKRFNEMSTFLVTPKFPIGEATDYIYDDYEDNIRTRQHPLRQNQRDAYYEDEYDYGDDFSDYDYEPKQKHSYNSYAPNNGYTNQNFNHVKKRFPEVPQYGVPETSYGTPLTFDTSGSYSHGYDGAAHHLGISNGHKSPNEHLYVLSETQLKSLIGHHNLNIEHLDIFQTASSKKKHKRPSFRKFKRRFPPAHRQSKIKKTLHKIQQITGH